MARYAARLGLTATNTGTRGALPRDYADMTGWREQAAATAAAWRALGLPYPVSVNGDFWAWGSGPPAATLLVVGFGPDRLAAYCGDAAQVGAVRNPLGVDEEREVPITRCRELREPLPAFWRRLGPQWG